MLLTPKALLERPNLLYILYKKYLTGFDELVRRLGASPAQVSRIQKGEANLTIASLAHIFALFGKQPHLTTRVV